MMRRSCLYLIACFWAACASPDAPPIPIESASTTGGDESGGSTYASPEIHEHPIGQCVMGQGWGAFAAERCGPASQKIIADEFCKAQEPGLIAVDWRVEKGRSGRHSIWWYDKGTPPSDGQWIHGLTVDRFTQIRCAAKDPTQTE